MPYRSRETQRKYAKDYYQARKLEYAARAKAQNTAIRALVRAAKNIPCVDCGQRYPFYVMQFDHRPGETKRFELSRTYGRGTYSLATVRAEIAKCDVVCANCHAERTYQRGQHLSARPAQTATIQPSRQTTLF